DVGAGRPFPDVADHLHQALAGCGCGMEVAVIEHVAVAAERNVSRRQLPLLFARQPLAGPLRVGCRLVEADMAYRLRRPPRPQAGEREHAVLVPIQRRLPVALLHEVPAGRQPELGPAVAAIVDESLVFAGRDEAGRQRERIDPRAMTRALVVEGEAATGSWAGMAGLDQAALEVDPAERRAFVRRRALRGVGREQWVQRQRVLDIHQDQLLMLLLVVQ